MLAIYGKTAEKRKLYEQSLNRYACQGHPAGVGPRAFQQTCGAA